ncbi:ATP synthase F1 subunit epsilon [Bartonella sp. TP]|uniref:ATP synthase F1 subunit epsilon n=1 Tax=Bartonella sp. TP TaxID=3057550 RepID=UPI0025B01E10|nr:ATP synthase F1 subunit epsilon [Bartonella sp. TP]MDN5248523.1 ATP synthase F1 subunit epsilon [Alphaproteobacteria bacterium]WJW79553.1 ATP synthase F1 subunit epsilon [Bartonella sp. TP]
MEKNFLFEIVTPKKLIFSEMVNSVVLPAAKGEMTILPQHAPVVTTVNPGIVTITNGANKVEYVVYGGFAQILGDKTSLLVDNAELSHEVDHNSLDERIKALKQALLESEFSPENNKHEDLLHQLTALKHSLTT